MNLEVNIWRFHESINIVVIAKEANLLSLLQVLDQGCIHY